MRSSQPLRKCFLVFILVTSFLLIDSSGELFARIAPIAKERELRVVTADKVEIVGYAFFPAKDRYPNPPLVVLLHRSGESHESWGDFPQSLCDSGFVALSMDFRGSGESTYDYKTSSDRPPHTYYIGEFALFPSDVAAMVRKTITSYGREFDTTKIGVVGAELGGTVGIMYAQNEPKVKFTAILSPGLELNELRLAPVIKDFGDRPLFLAAGSKDIYAVQSCDILSDVIPRVLDIHIYNSYHTGSMLLLSQLDLEKEIINELQKYLK